MMRRFLQISTLSLALLMALAFAAPALAAVPAYRINTQDAAFLAFAKNTTVEVLASSAAYVQATGTVNVRTGPGTGYTAIGRLKKGDVVEKTGTSGSWIKISYNGQTAYVSSSYVKETAAPGTATAVGYVQAAANVNVRSGPGTGYSKLGVLGKGEAVAKLGTSGSWTKIDFKGKIAYVKSQYLQAVNSAPSGSTSAAGHVVATANVNVRSGPGTGYNKLGQLYKGTIVPKLGTSGSWTIINYNGAKAYVSSQYLKASSYSGAGGGSNSTEGYNDDAAAELIARINGYRKKQGVAVLTTTSALNKAAKIRVQEITKLFSHTRPDGTACNTVDPDRIFGENIARGSGLPTAESAAEGFMNSARHRENAMRSGYTKTGAACLKVGNTTYWVQLFGY